MEKCRKAQRIFFWDDARTDCGVVVFVPGKLVPYPRIRDMIANLTAKASVREQYRRTLRFPLEDHYSEFGSLPEEEASFYS